MSELKSKYIQLVSEYDLRMRGKDWAWLTALCVLVYGISVAFRITLAGRWDPEIFWVGGERILATHDAYYWLALARGVGEIIEIPLAIATRFVHQMSGVSLGTIAFWAPAIIAPLTGVVCAGWGWLAGGRRAAVFAGMIGSLTPGFFYRSRLGYFDTDLFTLLSPMLVALLLAILTRWYCHSGWLCSSESDETKIPLPYALVLGGLFGLVGRLAGVWHLNIISINIILTLLACVYLAVNGRPGKRGEGFLVLTVFIVGAFPGSAFNQYTTYPLRVLWKLIPLHLNWMGCLYGALAVGVLVLIHKKKPHITQNAWVGACVLVAAVLMTNITFPALSNIIVKTLSYFPAATTGATTEAHSNGPVFPAILQSIIENKSLTVSEILGRGVFWPWLGWLALLVMPVVVAFRPFTVMLLPFVALQLLSMKMGARFTMFGGASMIVFLGIGLSFAIDMFAKHLKWRDAAGIGVQTVCALAMLVYCHTVYSKLPLTPVLIKEHAQALIELGKTADKDATMWTWWDWGYASQYFAGMETMVDGGKHSGRDVYPVGLALSTDSPRQANGIIRFSTQYPPKDHRILGYEPAQHWATLSGTDAMSQINQLKNESVSAPNAPAQYICVNWKDMTISKWISFYGNWDLEAGETNQFTVNNFGPGKLGFNIQRGAVMTRDGRGGLVTDATVLSENGIDTRHYFMNSVSPRLLPTTQHLYVNTVSKQSVLMDRAGARSMMTRLLTGDPNDPEITPYFKLVVDKLPFARIYEVVQ